MADGGDPDRGWRPVRVPAAGVVLDGDLTAGEDGRGLVLFAHGSGSDRHSPRNRQVAAGLRGAGLGAVLMDLLTAGEQAVDRASGVPRFDLDLLVRRLVAVVDWLGEDRSTAHLPLGAFGASTGAAAALGAAAERPGRIRAVACRGGRPDLVGEALRRVVAPTLLIVGGQDHRVTELNRSAAGRLAGQHDLVLVAGATHLFEEPGAMAEVTRLVGRWMAGWLAGGPPTG